MNGTSHDQKVFALSKNNKMKENENKRHSLFPLPCLYRQQEFAFLFNTKARQSDD